MFREILLSIIFILVLSDKLRTQIWSTPSPLYGGPVYSLTKDSNENLYSGSYSGIIYISKNGGISWEKLTDNLDDKDISSILINKNGDMYATASSGSGGVYKSINNGKTWIKLENGLSQGRLILYTLAVNKQGHLFAAGGGIFTSTNDGLSWKSISNGLSGKYAIDIKRMAINNQDHIFVINGYNGVYRSKDNGNTWEYLNFLNLFLSL